MSWFIDAWLWIVAVALVIPTFTLAVQCATACLCKNRTAVTTIGKRAACVVLVPGHNEELVIGSTLASLRQIIRDSDRIIVIADNCNDRTATIARESGVEVLIRNDLTLKGKGYAMQFGIDSLRECPPPIVVFVDADCKLNHNALDLLVEQAQRTNRVAQANYCMSRIAMDGISKPNAKAVISEFAVLVKNWVRPSGMNALGLPTHLTGSGMAFPWKTAAAVRFATCNIVEDMAIGCDLIRQGEGPLFCEFAKVSANLPATESAALEQRKRWEHGHLHTLIHQIPKMVWAAFKRRQIGLLAVACDLTIPPLSLLVMMLAGTWVAAALFFYIDPWPVALLTIEIAMVIGSLVCAGIRFSDDSELPGVVCALPSYALSKLPLYFSFALLQRQKQWVRTSRQPLDTGEA